MKIEEARKNLVALIDEQRQHGGYGKYHYDGEIALFDKIVKNPRYTVCAKTDGTILFEVKDCDEKGNVKECHYGKIPTDYGGRSICGADYTRALYAGTAEKVE